MKILALDCATKTGWAYWDGKRLVSGVQDFALKRGESRGILFLRFNRWLRQEFGGAGIVTYEQAHHRGGAATEVCVGLTTRAQEFAAEIRAESLPCHTATLKKFATGSGRAGKGDVVAAVMVRWGIGAQDDNEADAVALVQWAKEEVGA